MRGGGDQEKGFLAYGLLHELGFLSGVARVGVDADAIRIGAQRLGGPAHDGGTGGAAENASTRENQCAVRKDAMKTQTFGQAQTGNARETGCGRVIGVARGARAENQDPAYVLECLRLGDGRVTVLQRQDQKACERFHCEDQKEAYNQAERCARRARFTSNVEQHRQQRTEHNQRQWGEQGGGEFCHQHAGESSRNSGFLEIVDSG